MSLKTTKNSDSVTSFINSVEHEGRKHDAYKLLEIFEDATGEQGVMWGDSIIGFGSYSYTRSDNKTFEFLATGFSPRKANLSIYILPGYDDYSEELHKLGKYKKAKSCLYINKLQDIDVEVLKQIISTSFQKMNGAVIDYRS